MKKLITLLIIVGAAALFWWSFRSKNADQAQVQNLGGREGSPAIEIKKNPIVIKGPSASSKKEVVYQNNSFSPAALSVKVGDTVVFVNRHAAPIRLASNPHPIHTSFPEFDSDTLQPGESYEFTFKKPMTLNYHNHFNPGAGGKIIVE